MTRTINIKNFEGKKDIRVIKMQQMYWIYLFALTLPLIRATSHYCFKLASASTSLEQPLSLLGQPTVWIGITLYVVSFPMLLKLYKILPISRTGPLLSTTIIWTTLIGVFLLSEQMDMVRLLGIGLIVLGALVISTSKMNGESLGSTA